MLMGAMFDAAFQRFAAAFEKRAERSMAKPVRARASSGTELYQGASVAAA